MTDEHQPGHGHHPRTAKGTPDWDQRYASADRVWSGQPNGTLVTEVAGLRPGQALDVGCGEGADAVWLALRGWDVTAIDVSQVALERAALHARDAGAEVRWIHTGLLEAELPAAGFDLVSAQYPALLRTPTDEAEHALLRAVAPGGTLLVVHHADIDREDFLARHGVDPDDYVSPTDVAAVLGEGWQVQANEQRPRPAVSSGAGMHHTHDLVLLATRLR